MSRKIIGKVQVHGDLVAQTPISVGTRSQRMGECGYPRFDFVRSHDRLEVGDVRDHCPHLRSLISTALEILPHAVLFKL